MSAAAFMPALSQGDLAVSSLLIVLGASTLLLSAAIAINKLRKFSTPRTWILLLAAVFMLADTANATIAVANPDWFLTLSFPVLETVFHFPIASFLYIALMYRIVLFVLSQRRKHALMVWSYLVAAATYALLVLGMVLSLTKRIPFPNWAVYPVAYYPAATIASCLYTLYLARSASCHIDSSTSILVPLSTAFKVLTVVEIVLWAAYFWTQYGIAPTAVHPSLKLCIQTLTTSLTILSETSFEFLLRFEANRQLSQHAKSTQANTTAYSRAAPGSGSVASSALSAPAQVTASNSVEFANHRPSILKHKSGASGLMHTAASSQATIAAPTLYHSDSDDNNSSKRRSKSIVTLQEAISPATAAALPSVALAAGSTRTSSAPSRSASYRSNTAPLPLRRPSLNMAQPPALAMPEMSALPPRTPVPLPPPQPQQQQGFFMFQDVPMMMYGIDDSEESTRDTTATQHSFAASLEDSSASAPMSPPRLGPTAHAISP
ncbi:hypothetical protein RI367_007693 [Sorochytrium milnesiophthora]